MLFYKDKLFYILLSLGPVFWLLYDLFYRDARLVAIADMQALLMLLQVCLLYPVLEEVVFRGGLQGILFQERLAKWRVASFTLANVLTSAIFAAFHLLNQQSVWALLVFFPSLVFGFVFERYKSLWPPILVHIFYNTGLFVLFAS